MLYNTILNLKYIFELFQMIQLRSSINLITLNNFFSYNVTICDLTKDILMLLLTIYLRYFR